MEFAYKTYSFNSLILLNRKKTQKTPTLNSIIFNFKVSKGFAMQSWTTPYTFN